MSSLRLSCWTSPFCHAELVSASLVPFQLSVFFVPPVSFFFSSFSPLFLPFTREIPKQVRDDNRETFGITLPITHFPLSPLQSYSPHTPALLLLRLLPLLYLYSHLFLLLFSHPFPLPRFNPVPDLTSPVFVLSSFIPFRYAFSASSSPSKKLIKFPLANR